MVVYTLQRVNNVIKRMTVVGIPTDVKLLSLIIDV